MPALYCFSYRASGFSERDAYERGHGLDLWWLTGEVGVPHQARGALVERFGDVDRELERFLAGLRLSGVGVGVDYHRTRVGDRHRRWGFGLCSWLGCFGGLARCAGPS